MSNSGSPLPEVPAALPRLEDVTRDARIGAVRWWLERFGYIFKSKLKGLPPPTEDLPFVWYEGPDGTWGACYYKDMDKEVSGEQLEFGCESPFFFGFTGRDGDVVSISIQQGGWWLGVSTACLDHHLKFGLRGQLHFRNVVTYFRALQDRT